MELAREELQLLRPHASYVVQGNHGKITRSASGWTVSACPCRALSIATRD
jgi:hypothetical protein